MGKTNKTQYKISYAKKAYRRCLLGATDEELGQLFGVTEKTIHNWVKQFPNFAKQREAGKIEADARVAERFYDRAIGCTCKETKVTKDADGKVVSTVTTIKDIPPDPGACLNILKNRQPEKWRDKHDVDLGLTDDMADLLKEISSNGTGLQIKD